MTTDELIVSLSDEQRLALSSLLIFIKDDLNKEIIECNNYTRSRNDFGKTHRVDDPYETISYTRGKSVGYIESRDKINKVVSLILTPIPL